MFGRRQSDADPAPDQNDDPLSPYSSPTVRRPVGGTQPLGDGLGTQAPSDTQVGTDFSTRGVQRRARQTSTRVYPQRFTEMARRFDNRQLFLAAAGLILLLVALLAYQAYSRRANADAGAEGPAEAQTNEEAATGADEELSLPTAGAIIAPEGGADTGGLFATAVPGAPAAPDAAAPAAGAGGSFVVAGTGTEGLFLRSDHATDANVVATLPEGTRVEATGEQFNDPNGTRIWRKVRTERGEGWVASDFLVPAQ